MILNDFLSAGGAVAPRAGRSGRAGTGVDFTRGKAVKLAESPEPFAYFLLLSWMDSSGTVGSVTKTS